MSVECVSNFSDDAVILTPTTTSYSTCEYDEKPTPTPIPKGALLAGPSNTSDVDRKIARLEAQLESIKRESGLNSDTEIDVKNDGRHMKLWKMGDDVKVIDGKMVTEGCGAKKTMKAEKNGGKKLMKVNTDIKKVDDAKKVTINIDGGKKTKQVGDIDTKTKAVNGSKNNPTANLKVGPDHPAIKTGKLVEFKKVMQIAGPVYFVIDFLSDAVGNTSPLHRLNYAIAIFAVSALMRAFVRDRPIDEMAEGEQKQIERAICEAVGGLGGGLMIVAIASWYFVP